MDLKEKIGFDQGRSVAPPPDEMTSIINLKLLANGMPRYAKASNPKFFEQAGDLIRKIQEKFREYSDNFCPVDRRLQDFLDRYFGPEALQDGFREKVKLPLKTYHLDYHGLARELSLPADKNSFLSEYVSSYRVLQGVLHNPASDRRTTKGTFHISEGGMPIPGDKSAVPQAVFARLLWHAFHPPEKLLELPFTSTQSEKAKIFTSLFLKPLVSPEVSGVSPSKIMEMRFFAPGGLVSNLDFVESIFGNAGDPYLPENDAALDVDSFSGVTGCVVLAPHLTRLRKKDLGLPAYDSASERQKRDGMCWKDAGELYNGGQAFKATFRTTDGIIITLIADNYFGYCKKEVKTQIGFASNFLGLSEEEHSGGALVLPSYSLGDFTKSEAAYIQQRGYSFAQVKRMFGELMVFKPEGYAVDRKFPTVTYLPEDAEIRLLEQVITWKKGKSAIRLLPGHCYIYPSGYKVRMEKHPGAPSWRLIGTVAEGTLCHKPCTVSGGGKSEISKSIHDSIIYKTFYLQNFDKDFGEAEKILRRDYTGRFKVRPPGKKGQARPILSPLRSLGSVIKLLTPSPEYTSQYNRWLRGIPNHIRLLVFTVKRFYRPEWGEDLRAHFSVDIMDGRQGNELNFNHRKLVASYLRVGTDEENNWQVFRLRTDFIPSDKVQVEDDITVSITLPASQITHLAAQQRGHSVKFIQNCEYRLFQRPDDAVHKGLDKQAERDLADPNVFISNFEPLKATDAADLMNNTIEFEKFTDPMRKRIAQASEMPEDGYFVCSANPRLINGKPSLNMRYLQNRQDLVRPEDMHVAEMGVRLRRKIIPGRPVPMPVNSVLIGRRNNRSDRKAGIRPLSVYNPLHYQELPELFMDFIGSLTGKSPSTTGAGSEGALTKGPFNALRFSADLNNALVSYILTENQVFSTPAGYIGHRYRVDHDLSLLIPEIWSRMTVEERDAQHLISNGYFSKVEDFKYRGKRIEAGRLGYRINERFLHAYFGRVFSNPMSVFPADMLEPEKQGMEDFADGVDNIVESQRAAAFQYLEDGSVEDACPPLQGLLNIMVSGSWKGMELNSPEFRKMFTLKYLLASEWYRQRLLAKGERDGALWQRHCDYLRSFLGKEAYKATANALKLKERLKLAEFQLKKVREKSYPNSLIGTIGADTLGPPMA